MVVHTRSLISLSSHRVVIAVNILIIIVTGTKPCVTSPTLTTITVDSMQQLKAYQAQVLIAWVLN